jgi:hypothetical protein
MDVSPVNPQKPGAAGSRGPDRSLAELRCGQDLQLLVLRFSAFRRRELKALRIPLEPK